MKRRVRAFLPELVKTTVVAHTRDGKSIEGVLLAVHRDVIVLAHATYLVDDGTRERLEGDVVVPVGNVAFLQAVSA